MEKIVAVELVSLAKRCDAIEKSFASLTDQMNKFAARLGEQELRDGIWPRAVETPATEARSPGAGHSVENLFKGAPAVAASPTPFHRPAVTRAVASFTKVIAMALKNTRDDVVKQLSAPAAKGSRGRVTKAFDPGEPRDAHGRWTSGDALPDLVIAASKEEQRKKLVASWEKHGRDFEQEDLPDNVFYREARAWDQQHGTTIAADAKAGRTWKNDDFDARMEAKYLAGNKAPFPGVEAANQYFEDAGAHEHAVYLAGQQPDEWGDDGKPLSTKIAKAAPTADDSNSDLDELGLAALLLLLDRPQSPARAAAIAARIAELLDLSGLAPIAEAPEWAEVARDAAGLAGGDVGLSGYVLTDAQADAVDAARAWAAQLVSPAGEISIDVTTRSMIAAAIEAGMAGEEGAGAIVQAIAALPAWDGSVRGLRIATNELRRVGNMATLISYKAAAAAGAEILKRWALGEIDRHCPECISLAAMPPIALDATWPGDPPVEFPPLHVNCACFLDWTPAPRAPASAAKARFFAHAT